MVSFQVQFSKDLINKQVIINFVDDLKNNFTNEVKVTGKITTSYD